MIGLDVDSPSLFPHGEYIMTELADEQHWRTTKPTTAGRLLQALAASGHDDPVMIGRLTFDLNAGHRWSLR